MSSFKLNPGSKEIDSIGSFSQKATNMLKQFSKNFFGGSSATGAGAATTNKKLNTPKRAKYSLNAQNFFDSIDNAKHEQEFNKRTRKFDSIMNAYKNSKK